MRHKLLTITLGAGFLLPSTGGAQTADSPTPSKAATPDAGQKQAELAALPRWIQVGAVIRGRLEDPSGMNFVPGASDGYYLNRIRLDITVRPSPWLRFYAEGQDARVFGYNAPTQPATMHNALDLRQGYVEISSEDRRGFGLRVGRQELSLGSTRLIGISDWGLSRTFDAARFSLYQPGVKIDLFAASVVQIDAARFDRHKPGEQVFGSYFTLEKWGSKFAVEPYVFVKRQVQIAGEHGEIGDAAVGTLGLRFLGKLPGRIDYSAELARQWGAYAGDHISAMAGAYVAGWTVNKSPRKPRLSVEFDHASGDQANKDGRRQTFDQMHANNHSYYGIADLMGWRNMRDARAGFEFLIAKRLKLQADFNDFYLATTQDGFYNAGGTRTALNRSATSRHIGSEIDVFGSFQVTRTLSVGAGIAHLFAGDYLKQSTMGGGYNYPYFTWMKRL